jgi:hypothetical protein
MFTRGLLRCRLMANWCRRLATKGLLVSMVARGCL